jgi:hypothetical protein
MFALRLALALLALSVSSRENPKALWTAEVSEVEIAEDAMYGVEHAL